jgi:hypothetical protein
MPRHRERIGYIAHFPIRSLEQFRRKAALVNRIFDQIQDDPKEAWHWARLSVLFKHDLVEQEFSRQVPANDEIERRLLEGVLAREVTVSGALRALWEWLPSHSRLPQRQQS